ncbi:MAG: EamA family transporter, partial [Verrucomicrobiota bacterium]|nr:EamA family transporter [Verrucomicrobiota bacterium]
MSARTESAVFAAEKTVNQAQSPAPAFLVVAAFAAVYLIWGSTYLGIRVAIGSIPPLLMAGSRFLVAGAILFAVMRLRREPAPAPVHWRSAFITGVLLLLVGNGGVSLAERMVSTSLTALMIAATPLWMIVIEWLFHKTPRPKWTVFAGLVCGFGGVALLVLSRDVSGHKLVQPAGAGILMLASFCWAAGSIYSRRAPQPTNALLAVAMQMLA